MPILYIIPLVNLNTSYTFVQTGSTWPPGSTQQNQGVGGQMTLILEYSGGTYTRYEYEVYFGTSQIPSGSTIEAVTLYAYVSYALIINSPVYLNTQYYQGQWWTAFPRPEVIGAGQTLSQSLPTNSVTVGADTAYRFRAMYTNSDSAPTTTNQFNLPTSQIWLEVTVSGGLQMIV